MWNVLLPIIWIFGQSCCDGAVYEDSSIQTIQQDMIKNFKVDLQRTLEGARIRRKRQAGLLETISDSNGFQAKHFRVDSSQPEELQYLSQNNITTWTSASWHTQNQVFAGTQSGDYILLDVSENTENAKFVAYITGQTVGKKAKAFVFAGVQWFVVLQSNAGRTWLQMYKRENDRIITQQKIVLDGDSDFDFVTVRGVHYLVSVTYRTAIDESSFTYQGLLRLYHWTTTQFDLITYRTVYGASSVRTWSFDGYLYLAVTQEINDAGNINLGSPVYFFNAASEGGLVLLHNLKTKGPKKVTHFQVSGNQYLVFIGRSDAEIFWWSNGQFLSWQVIDGTAGAIDLSVLSLYNGEVVLVVALTERVLFLSLDATGHYIVTFTMQFNGFDIASLQFMFDGQYYYALILASAYAGHYLPPVWKLTLDKYDLPDVTSMDTLLQCLSSLRDVTNERQMELEAVEQDVARIWVSDKDQIISSPVIVKGSITSPTARFSADRIVIRSDEIIDVTPSQLEDSFADVALLKDSIVDDLKDVVFKSTDQEIAGSVYFNKPVIVPSLYLPSVETDIFINDIKVDQLIDSSLKLSGNQSISGSVTVDHMSVNSAIVGSINNKELNDVVLLHGQYNITGSWQFTDVRMTDLSASTLNSISLSKLVLTNTDQDITGLKHFDYLSANVIDVDDQTNGNFLREVAENIITLDGDQTISAKLQFASPLTILGDVTIEEPINGMFSLSTLDSEAVKTDVDQEISGEKVFLSDLAASGDVIVDGLINGVDLSRLMTLSTRQTITGNITFESEVSFENLFVKSINGLNLNQDAVLRDRDEFISGHKVFKSSLVADNVVVSDMVTINGIDLSHEAEVVVKHIDGVIDNAGSAFANIVVTGDLTALSGINGFEVSDLPKTVWLKNEYQEIDVPLTVRTKATFMSDLNATLVNNLDLRTDVAHVFSNNSISEEVTFTNNVHVMRNTDVASGKLLAGVDFEQFQEQVYLDKLYMDRTVRGTKTISSLEVTGSLSSNDINGLDLQIDTLRPDLPQTIYGDLWFDSVTLNNDLVADHIAVSTFNDFPLEDHIRSSVSLKNLNNITLNNKIFSYLKADGLLVSATSEIGGVNFMDMINRTVMLDSPQKILGQKVFENAVFFEDSVVTKTFNGMDLPELVDKVVFTDQPAVISGQKTFTGSVSAQNVFTDSVNGLNLSEMAADVFSKTKNVDVFSHVTFLNGVQAGDLYVDNALVDGISLDDVISTKHDIVFEQPIVFKSDVFLKDAFVTGLVNGCSIDDVNDYALRTFSDSPQVYTGNVFVEDLDVSGNLEVEGSLNEVPLQILKDSFVGNSVYQVVEGNLFIHPGMSVHNIQLNGNLNGTDLSGLMLDAVMRTSDQTIYGSKTFTRDLEVEVLTGEIDAYISGTVDDVDVDRLLSTVVSKSEFQVVQGDKIFRDLVVKNATAFEYLNGLRLPQDVVLTGDEEFIPSSVVIMNDVEISSSLTVNGKIDGFNLEETVPNLVSLDGEDVIEADITFSDDVFVEGDLSIDGMVNDIPLEMVATVSKDVQIDGRKEFAESVSVGGNVQSSLVNGLNIENLFNNIIRHASNETLKTQVFDAPIYIKNDLSVDLINGVSLQSVRDKFLEKSAMLQSSIMNLKQSSVDYSEKLLQYLEASKDRVSQFAYFILHQEIFLGSATKILSGYNQIYEDSTDPLTLVMQTTSSKCYAPNSCCIEHHSYWMTMDPMGTLTIAFGPHLGRYFPVVPLNHNSRGGKFAVWTNTSMEEIYACSENIQDTIIGSVRNSGFKKEYLQVNDPSILVDVASFKDGYTFVVAAYYRDAINDQYSPTIVYRGRESSREWVEYQVLDMYGALSMDMTVYKLYDTAEILLALGSGMGTYPDVPSLVYKWNSVQKRFDFVQNLLSEFVHSILWVKYGQQLLLCVASSQFAYSGDFCTDTVSSKGQIDVYLYRERLHIVQSWKLPTVVSMITFAVEGEVYLAAASRYLQTVVIYQMQGYSGFQAIQSIPSEDVRHLNSFWKNNQLYMSVSSGKGHSKILRAVIRGQNTRMMKFNSTIGDAYELGDDPSPKKSTC